MRIPYLIANSNVKHHERLADASLSSTNIPLYNNKDTININFCGIPSPSREVVENLKNHVENISAIVPRSMNDIDGLNKTAEYIKGEWEKLGLKVNEQKYTLKGKEYKNVYVSLGPENADRLIIGAHYDTVAPDVPGADDNASAVAGMLELTRLLKESPDKLDKRLDLVAFTLEEHAPGGLKNIGSAKYAEKVKKEIKETGKKPIGMISLEMLGCFSKKHGSQKSPSDKENWGDIGDFLLVTGISDHSKFVTTVTDLMQKHSEIPVKQFCPPRPKILTPPTSWTSLIILTHPESRYAISSDNISFLKICPAIMLTDTIELRNPHYHTSTDTPKTLNYTYLGEVVQGLAKTVCEIK